MCDRAHDDSHAQLKECKIGRCDRLYADAYLDVSCLSYPIQPEISIPSASNPENMKILEGIHAQGDFFPQGACWGGTYLSY